MKRKPTQHFFLLFSCLIKIANTAIFSCIFLFSFQAEAQTTSINVPGQSNPRTIFVYAPAGIAQNRPLVISMHGLNQDINYQKGQAKWELVADTAKFVVVYPAGERNSWDINGTKDTDFLLAIIESMVTRFGIDRNRVYVSGFSMGGMMSYNAANKIANKIAAIGPVSGYLFNNIAASSRPMPIIHVHGNADDVVRYQPYSNQQGVVAMLQKWRSWNQCPAAGTKTTPYPANRLNSKSAMEYWGPCNNSAVQLVTLDGKGHWHSNDATGVNTTNELWAFFRKHTLNNNVKVSQGPFNETPSVIPGIIQAEHFDVGGNDFAYHDKTPGSQVTPSINFRGIEDVDIETTLDAGGGYNIAYTMAGEWLEYTVNVSATGRYDLSLRMASDGAGKTMHAEIDGQNLTGAILIPNTGGFQIWQTILVPNLQLTAGKHTLRLVFDSDYLNINYIKFDKAAVTSIEDGIDAETAGAAFPNPFERTIVLNYKHDFNYKIFDLAGKLMLQGVAKGQLEVGEELPCGVYLLQVLCNENIYLSKIHKK